MSCGASRDRGNAVDSRADSVSYTDAYADSKDAGVASVSMM